MKRILPILMILTCLIGCTGTPIDTQPITTTPTTQSTTAPTEPTTVPTTQPDPTEPAVYVQPALPQVEAESRQLTSQEIEAFADLFDPSGDVTMWYNRALTSRYDSPAEMNILYFLYSIPMEEITPEDEAFFGNAAGALHKYSVSLTDEKLMFCFGITLAETNGIGLEEMVYNEDGHCYYHDHGDMIGFLPSFFDGYVYPDGTVQLYYNGYEDIYGPDGAATVVTLKYADEDGTAHWYILSNVKADA